MRSLGRRAWRLENCILRGFAIVRASAPDILPIQIARHTLSDIRQNTIHHRFELDMDGHTAIAAYRLAPGVITFMHTDVPKALAGRGVGSRLVHGALEAARAQGLKVVAECPFVAGYIAKHPEFSDLLF